MIKARHSFIIFLVLILAQPFLACTEQEDPMIRTDLPTEAQQLYTVSKLLYEHVNLGLKSFDDFLLLSSEDIPGCPVLTIEEEAKRVILDYKPSEDCSSGMSRTGKIILDLALQSPPENNWFMEFEDYSLKSDTLNGFSTFKRLGLNSFEETFQSLNVKSESLTSFDLNGRLVHEVNGDVGNSQDLFSTTGEILGRNPAGRNFSGDLGLGVLFSNSCLSQMTPIPLAGSETWTVDRGNQNSVIHQLSYETAGPCETTAKMLLPDGRTLILDP